MISTTIIEYITSFIMENCLTRDGGIILSINLALEGEFV